METFLPRSEVEELTGYKRQSSQRMWLLKQGIKHFVDRFGRPMIVKESLVAQTGEAGKKEIAMPDFEALSEVANGS